MLNLFLFILSVVASVFGATLCYCLIRAIILQIIEDIRKKKKQ